MIDAIGYDELNKIIWENKDKIVILYFGTSWCGPCKMLKDKIDNEKDNITESVIIHIDCDEQENEDILNDWNVKALPTQIFVHLDGKNVVKDDIIEGFDWIKFLMTYNKIIENKKD